MKGYILLLLVFLIAAVFGGFLLYTVFMSSEDRLVLPFDLGFLNTQRITKEIKEELPPQVEEVISPSKRYQIEYFDVDLAEDKSLVKAGEINATKRLSIERVLEENNFQEDHINSYSVVLMHPGLLDNPGKIINIYKNGEALPIATLDDNNGTVHHGFKYIVLSSQIYGLDLSLLYLHELGHTVKELLSEEEFREYMVVRKMPAEAIDRWEKFLRSDYSGFPPQELVTWEKNPNEDFAEIFMYHYRPKEIKDFGIRTIYGQPTQEQLEWFERVVGPKIVE